MKKRISLFIAVLFIMGFVKVFAGQNIMKLHDATGLVNDEVTLELEILNEDEFVTFQVDVILPAGFDYVPGSGQFFRAPGFFFQTFTTPDPNILRLVAYAMGSFQGNSGTVASFTLTTAGTPGSYIFNLQNVVIGNASAQNILTGVEPGTVSLCETIDVTANITPVSCFNGSDGAITITSVSGGINPYSFSWIGPAGFGPVTNQNISDLAAGTYTLTVTDNIECSTTVSFLVNEPEDLPPPEAVDAEFCFDGELHTASATTSVSGAVIKWYTTQSGDIVTSAPSGTDVGTYTAWAATDLNGCESSQRALVTLTILSLPVMTCPEGFSVCINDNEIALSGALPEGGVYSGEGVVDGTFYPGEAGVGTHEITYSYTDPDTNCENSCVFEITVNALPLMTCPENLEVCFNDEPVTLANASPNGGTYSGNGVSDGFFTPATAGVGTHTITYTYIDPETNCENACTFQITVHALPAMTCPENIEVCLDSAPLTLSGGLPEGGEYTGTGVTDGQFDPVVAGEGVFEITYTYTEPTTNCQNSCNFEITVHGLPAAPEAGIVTFVYNAELQMATAIAPTGSVVKWYDAANNGNETTAPSGIEPGVYPAVWAASVDQITGCESATRTEIILSILPLLGDANCDGKVTVLDATVILNYVAGIHPIGAPFCFEQADVDGNGQIQVLDATGILNIIAGP